MAGKNGINNYSGSATDSSLLIIWKKILPFQKQNIFSVLTVENGWKLPQKITEQTAVRNAIPLTGKNINPKTKKSAGRKRKEVKPFEYYTRTINTANCRNRNTPYGDGTKSF